ncbi:uncharacterized protein FIBRA_00625 [Fibroporia radiculosa]|uniref:Uncharacterized protein n=1 Tax=Fibroporia radiculosa TaxID=599839 RepID=J4G0I2_9APHY|nr:uncharacterized protein FIBRA_00625 [Fibroporia radiculosa]CCL98623.1 predicted protein [Fibroporia radiculosa]
MSRSSYPISTTSAATLVPSEYHYESSLYSSFSDSPYCALPKYPLPSHSKFDTSGTATLVSIPIVVSPSHPSSFAQKMADYRKRIREQAGEVLRTSLALLSMLVLSAIVGLLWSMCCTWAGCYVFHQQEPYKSVNLSTLSATSAPGGAIICTGGSVLLACLLSRASKRWDPAAVCGVAVVFLATGFFGQALGVCLLRGKIHGGLDVIHALQSSAVGQAVCILGLLAGAGSHKTYNSNL